MPKSGRKARARAAWRLDQSRILTRREVATVLADLCRRSKRSKNSRMNRMVFLLSTCCGLRVSEICGLRMKDVLLEVQRPVLPVRAEIAKNGRARTVPLWRLPSLLEHFRAWKVYRSSQGAGPSDPLLCSQASHAAGKALSRFNAARRFRVACRALGRERFERLTIHDGRHTCASHLLASGWPLPLVRDTLGHASLNTTSIYSHVLVDDDSPRDPFGSS